MEKEKVEIRESINIVRLDGLCLRWKDNESHLCYIELYVTIFNARFI